MTRLACSALLLALLACAPRGPSVTLELEVAYPVFNPSHKVWALYRMEQAGEIGPSGSRVYLKADCSRTPCRLVRIDLPGGPSGPWIRATVRQPGSATERATLVLSPFPLSAFFRSRWEPLDFEKGVTKLLKVDYAPKPCGELQLRSWKVSGSRKGDPPRWK